MNKTLGGLNIVYSDEVCFVVEKPAGMLTYSAKKDETQKTLADEIRSFINFPKTDYEAGVAHRLDRDTSGLVLCGRTPAFKEKLQQLFKNRTIKKYYYAIANGRILEKQKLLHFMLRDENSRMKRKTIPFLSVFEPDDNALSYQEKNEYSAKKIFASNALVLEELKNLPLERVVKKQFALENLRLAITSISPLAIFLNQVFLEVQIYTGRTHQIRAQLANIAMPVLGDTMYNNKNMLSYSEAGLENIKESHLYLHAAKLSFFHPLLNKQIEVKSKLPAYFKEKIEHLKAVTSAQEK